MLLYFGSKRMMHQPNTCLCDVHHSRPNLWDLPELAFAPRPGSAHAFVPSPGSAHGYSGGRGAVQTLRSNSPQQIPFKHG